ncbi:UDP-glycosyltransferase 71K1-like [Mercurialis annua]|uniref:UDP-glycosyltransferase 71K1-like n=1 Tax=Mercurialis annua TaxID=3986 RepID=UPI00215DD7BA|nr:UDP-glycosyltransferase 71K1-like [Mercurialis annua]
MHPMEKKMKKVELVFVSMPGVGHLVSTIEFAKTLINRCDHLFITIIVMKIPTIPFLNPYVQSIAASQPNIHFIHLPDQVDGLPPLTHAAKSIQSYYCAVIDCYKLYVKKIISDVTSAGSVAGIVLDLFCGSLADIGSELSIPSFVFFTSGALFLSFLLHLPARHQLVGSQFAYSDPDMLVPGFVNLVPPSSLPEPCYNDVGGYAAYLKIAKGLMAAKGILVNTFTELESHALESLNNGEKNPNVYAVGPVLHLKSQPHPQMNHGRWETIKNWLDQQPDESVVFLCFGSAGFLTLPQVNEMALGLEQSGHRFLWSLRVPPAKNEEFKDAEEMLPEGFMGRIQGRGMVCGWAPQVEVLAHKAIGGFVSHCGWNSVLESLWYGVPTASLPLYAEQAINAFITVKELGLAVNLKMDYRPNRDVVTADEVKRALSCVMEADSEVRKKVKNMSEMARNAVKEGGSSFSAVSQFINDLVGSSS